MALYKFIIIFLFLLLSITWHIIIIIIPIAQSSDTLFSVTRLRPVTTDPY